MNTDLYCENKGIEHYIDLFGKKPDFPWQNHIVQFPEQLDDFEYYKYSGRYEKDLVIDLEDVVGTHHIDYRGKKWIEMFGCLKHGHQKSAESAEKWLSTMTNTISLNKYDGKYYVGGDGNHRVCYAKFLGYKKLKVHSVSFYELDEKHINYRGQLINLNLEINSWSDDRYDVQMGEIELFIRTEELNQFIELFENSKLGFVDRLKFKYLKDENEDKFFWFSPKREKEVKHLSKLIGSYKLILEMKGNYPIIS